MAFHSASIFHMCPTTTWEIVIVYPVHHGDGDEISTFWIMIFIFCAQGLCFILSWLFRPSGNYLRYGGILFRLFFNFFHFPLPGLRTGPSIGIDFMTMCFTLKRADLTVILLL